MNPSLQHSRGALNVYIFGEYTNMVNIIRVCKQINASMTALTDEKKQQQWKGLPQSRVDFQSPDPSVEGLSTLWQAENPKDFEHDPNRQSDASQTKCNDHLSQWVRVLVMIPSHLKSGVMFI